MYLIIVITLYELILLAPYRSRKRNADRSEWIPADESTGYGRFTVDVEALNSEMPCAAYSKKKDMTNDVIGRLGEYTVDLLEMAGIYEEADAGIAERNSTLSSDVIL